MLRRLSVPVLLLFMFASCASRVSYRELAREYYNLGNAFFELGDYETSFDYYSRAIELDDELPASSYNLARLHIRREEYGVAKEVVLELLQDDPENSLYRETHAYILFLSGKTVEARKEYLRLIEQFPARSRLRYNLALLEIQAEAYRTALQILHSGLENAAEDSRYHWLIAEAAYLSDEVDQAAAFLELYRSLVEGNPEDLTRLAERYASWDFPLAAMEILEQIPEQLAQDKALQFLAARLHILETSEFERGIEFLGQALRLGFDDTKKLRELRDAVSPDDQEALDELYREYELELDPDDPPEETRDPAAGL